jgi:hypothetical protein
MVNLIHWYQFLSVPLLGTSLLYHKGMAFVKRFGKKNKKSFFAKPLDKNAGMWYNGKFRLARAPTGLQKI